MNFFKKFFTRSASSQTSNTDAIIENHAPQETPLQPISEETKTRNTDIFTVHIPELVDGYPRYYTIKKSNIIYDLETLDGINMISEELDQIVDIVNYAYPIEYILQRKATEHKKNNRMDLAIACLKKSNNIMKYNTNYYLKTDFLRLPAYMRQIGDFDQARKEEEYINSTLFPPKSIDVNEEFATLKQECLSRNTDLAVAAYKEFCSAECSMYRARVYSISGNDTRFPALPLNIFEYDLYLRPFIEGISDINVGGTYMDPIEYSNRPFKDDRTDYEKKVYEESVEKARLKEINQKDYNWLLENFPNIAPKSFSGYVKMKNSNSKNFQKLQEAAKEKGYII